METGIYYDIKKDKFVRIDKSFSGKFTYYRTKDLGKKGARIRGHIKNEHERLFDTQEQAIKGFPFIAKKLGFVSMSYNNIVQLNRSRLIGSTTSPPW